MTMKLYKVKTRAFHEFGTSYVVAENPDLAYKIVRKYLNDNDIGFSKERELDSIELLAENKIYPECGTHLYIEGTDAPDY